jgi:hypothetical protein
MNMNEEASSINTTTQKANLEARAAMQCQEKLALNLYIIIVHELQL